jgi:Flagellar basal body L-ring protein
MRSAALALVACSLVVLTGCSSPPKMAAEEFAPVLQLPTEPERLVTGSIYNGGRNDNWFGRKRDYRVGDIITVILNEQTQSNRVNNTSAKRKTSNDVAAGLVPSLVNNLPGFARERAGRLTNGLKLNGSEINSEATGSTTQNARLEGSVAVTVTEVLTNGNLVVRGEKVLDLSEGSETIRVAGIVRSEDIAPNGTVLSRRLANAQIAYTGTGIWPTPARCHGAPAFFTSSGPSEWRGTQWTPTIPSSRLNSGQQSGSAFGTLLDGLLQPWPWACCWSPMRMQIV